MLSAFIPGEISSTTRCLMLTYAVICWRMLSYVDVCCHMLTYAVSMHTYRRDLEHNSLSHADVCWRMLTYAVICWRMLSACIPAGEISSTTFASPPIAGKTYMSAYVSIRQHMTAYVCIWQHTSAYGSIRPLYRHLVQLSLRLLLLKKKNANNEKIEREIWHMINSSNSGRYENGALCVCVCVCVRACVWVFWR
jgi:hypothetical protein